MATVEAVEIMDSESGTTVRWGAIALGAVVGLAVTVAIVVLGVGIGLSIYNPWAPIATEVKQISLGAIVWFCAAQLWGLFVGGYATGWLIDRDFFATSHERRVRNALHGGAVWGLALILGTLVSALIATSAISTTARIAALDGAAGSAAVAAGVVDEGTLGTLSRELMLTESTTAAPAAPAAATPAPAGSTAPAATTDSGTVSTAIVRSTTDSALRMNDIAPVLRRSWVSGEMAASDRKYLAQGIARANGIGEADAERRVAATETKIREAATKARETADKARKAGAYTAFWSFVALLLGAVAAVGGAMCGGAAHLREDQKAAGIIAP